MDIKQETGRAKWIAVILLVFLGSCCLSYQEVNYFIRGKTTQARVLDVSIRHGRRNRTYTVVEYAFDDSEGNPRRGADEPPSSWTRSPDDTTMISYLPGEDGPSRLAGNVSWLSLSLLAISSLIIGGAIFWVWMEGREAYRPRPRRRER